MSLISVFLCDSYFPYGRAYSSRVLNISRLLQNICDEVIVIADYSTITKSLGEYQTIDGIKYVSLGTESRKYNYFKRNAAGTNAVARVVNSHIGDDIYIIISAGDIIRYKTIKNRFRLLGNVHIIIECCEWYDRTSYILSDFDPRFILFKYRMNHDYFNETRVIVISRWLEAFFSNNPSKKVVRIPTILDTEFTKYATKTGNEKIKIMFAGSMGGDKELFTELLYALSAPTIKENYEFHVYGGTEEKLEKCLGKDSRILQQLNGVVFCHGFVKQEEINAAYSLSDFSVIFRPDRKSSHAGFPTKLAESMASGTPVIANDTGDVSLYINHDNNGYLIKYDRQAIEDCLLGILNKTENERSEMRKEARKTAEDVFDYRCYIEQLKSLFKN